MKRLCLSLLFVVALVSLSKSQTLSPTELESATLAKLKAQHDGKLARLQLIDTQIALLQTTRVLAQQDEQQKLSELLGKGNDVIRDHKWSAEYKQDQTEIGTFITKPEVKPEKK